MKIIEAKVDIKKITEIPHSTIGKVVAISVSKKKGTAKQNIENAELIEDWGIEGDAHAGRWHRQVSLLANESINKMRNSGLPNLRAGAFAENITTEFINIPKLEIGTHVKMGNAELEITQIGKECHDRCAIYAQVGDCVMPREGIFAKVLKSGSIEVGEEIAIIKS
jgi:cyclic pyranopterin monophosphate synthase